MKHLVIVFLFGVYISGCSKDAYLTGITTNNKTFEKSIKLISDYENGKNKVFVEEYRFSIFFLGFVTGWSSKADYSSTIGYENKADFEDDINHWWVWYKFNKSRLTDQYIDSVYGKLGILYDRSMANNLMH